MPKKLFDTQDLAIQVDVLRKHLRHWFSMHGPVPAELAADHDVSWEARESARLQKIADDAEAHAAALADAEGKEPAPPPTPAEVAAQRAADARAAAAQFSGGAGVGDDPWKGSSRDPNAPKSVK